MMPIRSDSRHSVSRKMTSMAMIVSNKVNEVSGRAVDWMEMAVLASVAKPTPLVTTITSVFSSHGRPRQNRMSKMFEPIELQMAMSARPAFFTIK